MNLSFRIPFFNSSQSPASRFKYLTWLQDSKIARPTLCSPLGFLATARPHLCLPSAWPPLTLLSLPGGPSCEMPSPSSWRFPARQPRPVSVYSLSHSGSHHFLSASFPTQLPSSGEQGPGLCVFLTFLDRHSHKHQRFTDSSPRFLCCPFGSWILKPSKTE